MNFGRVEFRSVPGETPKPQDVPIQPGETHVFKLSKPRADGLKSFAKDEGVPPLNGVLVYFHFISFGDGTGWEGPEGKTFNRQKRVSLNSAYLRTAEHCFFERHVVFDFLDSEAERHLAHRLRNAEG